jgi:tripartite-type tricarboxylate transporter receptor subunit TctC
MTTMKPWARLGAGLVLLAGLLGAALPSQAQTWPQRTVKLILPLGPGSGADIGARMYADRLSKRWGQTVVVENRPGADGIVAINAFIGANDDHTLLFGPSSAFVAHPYLHARMPYDASKLSPIARVSKTLVVVAVPASLNVKSLADLMAMVRAQPGKLNWATVTGVTDLIVAGTLKSAGLDMAKVPYRDTVHAINDLAEGRIQMYIAALAIARPHVQSGRIKLIAVTNQARASFAPDLPTVAEAGFPTLEFDGLAGFFGVPQVPDAVRARIAADVKAASDEQIVSRLLATGQVVIPGGPAEFAASIKEQADKLAAVAKTLGITPKQ